MATPKADTHKGGYPKFPTDNWWALRKRFVQTIQIIVNESYLSSILQMKPTSARVRISTLRKVGLISEDGKPTERAKRWRDDNQYAAVCEEIRQSVYPPELLNAFPAPSPDRAEVARWFGHETGVGEDAASQLTSFYLLLCEASPKQQDGSSALKTPKNGRGSSSAKVASGTRSQTSQGSAQNGSHANAGATGQTTQQPVHTAGGGLSLHVDIQIHISPEADAQQIDQIFKSIGMHLGQGGDAM